MTADHYLFDFCSMLLFTESVFLILLPSVLIWLPSRGIGWGRGLCCELLLITSPTSPCAPQRLLLGTCLKSTRNLDKKYLPISGLKEWLSVERMRRRNLQEVTLSTFLKVRQQHPIAASKVQTHTNTEAWAYAHANRTCPFLSINSDILRNALSCRVG